MQHHYLYFTDEIYARMVWNERIRYAIVGITIFYPN